MSFANPLSIGKWYIYDHRLGCRHFSTRQERDKYYDNAPWIDQKNWSKGDLIDK